MELMWWGAWSRWSTTYRRSRSTGVRSRSTTAIWRGGWSCWSLCLRRLGIRKSWLYLKRLWRLWSRWGKRLNRLRNCSDSVAKGARSTWCVHFRVSLFFFFFFGLDCVCLVAEKILEESARKSYCCCYNWSCRWDFELLT